MNITRHHTVPCLLALAVLATVGSGETYAQRGRFRSGGNMSQFNNGPKFGQNNSLQKMAGGLQGSTIGNPTGKQFGTGQSGSGFNLQNRSGLPNLNGSNFKKGGLPQVLGNHKLQQGRVPTQSSNGEHRKLNGLQNLIRRNDDHKGAHNGGGTLHANGNPTGQRIGNLMQRIQHNQKHGKVCLGHDDWCHTKPKSCHWWYQYCKPIAYCEPQHHHHCEWNYVTCNYTVGGRVVLADARWYLGLKGLLLPGQGLGIEEIAPGSPAASVGLQPGMVITRCNGIDLVDEAALGLAIAQSGGVLQMDLLLSSEGTPATCVVVMQRVASVSF